MTHDEFIGKYREVSGDILSAMCGIDIQLSMILAHYFAKNDRVQPLMQVFAEYVDFDKKKQLVVAIVGQYEEFQGGYVGLSTQLGTFQEMRNKFAHCPLDIDLSHVKIPLGELKEITLIKLPKINETFDPKNRGWKYNITRHEENKKDFAQLNVWLHEIAEMFKSGNPTKITTPLPIQKRKKKK